MASMAKTFGKCKMKLVKRNDVWALEWAHKTHTRDSHTWISYEMVAWQLEKFQCPKIEKFWYDGPNVVWRLPFITFHRCSGTDNPA